MQNTSPKLKSAPCDSCQEKASEKHRKISNMAYQIFLQEGRRPGRTTENWYEAEMELAAEQQHSVAMPCGCGYTTFREQHQ